MKVCYAFLCAVAFLLCPPSFAQPLKILHYSETSGFDHHTRITSFAMFQQMGAQHGFTVDNDSSGQAFNSLSSLQQYDVVIFSNTSGDNILDVIQKQNFEQYMNGNGAYVGIHAASDTYRHSSANGSNTGGWDWYVEMLGASVQQNPNHVTGTPVYRIDAIIPHMLLSGVPNPWNKAEEYYYWEGGYFSSSNIVLQKVEQTIGPNSQVNSYDSSRAVSWYKYLPGGGRSFYTALGHSATNFSGDTSFYRLLANAVLWAGNKASGTTLLNAPFSYSIFPNPVEDQLTISTDLLSASCIIKIYNIFGIELERRKVETERTEINFARYPAGIYFIQLSPGEKILRAKLIKQ